MNTSSVVPRLSVDSTTTFSFRYEITEEGTSAGLRACVLELKVIAVTQTYFETRLLLKEEPN